MSREERKKNARYLKHGDIIQIAKASGITISNVSKWINGHLETSTCEMYFTALVERRKNEIQKAISSI